MKSITRLILIVHYAIVAGLLTVASVNAQTLKNHVCNIVQVDLQMNGSENYNRLMVKCDSPATATKGKSIWYFAVNTTRNPERAKMALSIMTTAKVAGRSVRISYFSDDSSPNAWGMSCNQSDCRPIVRIELL